MNFITSLSLEFYEHKCIKLLYSDAHETLALEIAPEYKNFIF